MQTFLPHLSFRESARCLDRQRLGKQRIECKQILRALAGESKGWARHPATLRWRGHERALCHYAAAVCVEWRRRGYNDAQLDYFLSRRHEFAHTGRPDALTELPELHRASLYRKAPQLYAQFADACAL